MVVVLGQPRLKDFLITLSFECCCEAKSSLLAAVRPGSIIGCSACGKLWQIQQLRLNDQYQLTIGMAPFVPVLPAGVVGQ